MRIILSTLFFLATVMIYAQGFLPISPPNPNSARTEDIFFLNSNLGYVCDGAGRILKITNEGDSVEVIYTNSSYYLRSIEFFNADTGFCGSLENALLKTVDGGSNWEVVELEFDIPGICGMHAFDDGTIFASGAWFGPAYYIISTDFGTTWTYHDMSEFATALVDVYFVNDTTGFIGGKNDLGAVLLKTTDRGETWNTVYNSDNPEDYIWKVHTLPGNPEKVYCSHQSPMQLDAIDYIWSEDMGESFQARSIDFYGMTQDVFFMNESLGFRTGHNGPLHFTSDGGNSWNIGGMGSNGNRFFMIDEENLYLGANTIYKYSSGVVSAGASIFNDRQDAAIHIFPNPASSHFTLSMQSEKADHLILSLYQLDGRFVEGLLKTNLETGDNRFEINTAHLSTGVYLIAAHINNGVHTRKLVVE